MFTEVFSNPGFVSFVNHVNPLTSVNPDTLLMTYRYYHCYKYTTNARAFGEPKNNTLLALLILSHRTARIGPLTAKNKTTKL